MSKANNVVQHKPTLARGLEIQSKEAKKAWKADEQKLPTPRLYTKIESPLVYLWDTLQYARGANSRGEFLFRTQYLQPLVDKYVKANEQNSSWVDGMGNVVVHIGANPFDTLHVGHIDTVHSDSMSPFQAIAYRDVKGIGTAPDSRQIFLPDPVKNSAQVVKKGIRWVDDVKIAHHYIDYELTILSGKRCLGADDGCAIAVMLWLMQHQVEGTYMFPRGEEIGCVGTRYMVDRQENGLNFSLFKRAVEVDRKGEVDMIVEMGVGICASEAFGKSFAKQLNMGHKCSDKGSSTDVGVLAKYIPECVNLAAGYLRQHSDNEVTNPDYLHTLAERLRLVDWSKVTHERTAGHYTRPRPVATHNNFTHHHNSHPYSNNSANLYGGRDFKTRKQNTFGDWTTLDLAEKKSFAELFEGKPRYDKQAFVRENNNLITEFLDAINLSPLEMVTVIADYEQELLDARNEAREADDAELAALEEMHGVKLNIVIDENEPTPTKPTNFVL